MTQKFAHLTTYIALELFGRWSWYVGAKTPSMRTLSITKLSIMTLRIRTLSKMTISLMILCISTFRLTTLCISNKNETFGIVTLFILTLRITTLCITIKNARSSTIIFLQHLKTGRFSITTIHAEFRYAEPHGPGLEQA